MNEGERAVRAIVTGKVQRVGFRWFVVQRAQELELVGWVRNLADGAVEVVARGPRARVDELLKALWQGPPRAEVVAVHFKEPDIEELTMRHNFEAVE